MIGESQVPCSWLQGAYDVHVHCGPDVVPRSQDLIEVAQKMRLAGMAGAVIKDHTTCTAGRAYALNQLFPSGPRFFSSLVLNPPVGGLNPFAVEAALREGADVIYFPTYAARHQIAVRGQDAFSPAYPRPRGFEGIGIMDGAGGLQAEVKVILDLIAQYDAVLATGHIAPHEVLCLLQEAQGRGVRRMLVTHASEIVPGMTVEQQLKAVAHGAFIEHCLLAILPNMAHPVAVEVIRDQIRQVGVGQVIVSSDLGQAANGPIVEGFAHYLGKLAETGFSDDEIRTMIAENPQSLLTARKRAGS